MKKTLAFFGLAFILASCGALKEGAPEDLIPSDKMALILHEVHKTETITSRMSFNTYDSSKVAYNYLESKIFEKFDVDSSQYRRSYDFYATNPDLFVRIYENIEGMLEKELDEQ